ncbi:MAG: ATP synthase F1 subunit gamma [Clostridia bacterium]|nr:ATP synthase F1 subunit gamma [Clostridia bacterium]
MVPSMKAIKNRIKSVENTRQITKAMQLVATSKLRRAKERIEQSRPFFEILSQTLSDIEKSNKDFSSPFTHRSEGTKTCHIVIAGDRGLAGGYNNNLFKSLRINDGDIIFPIGKKVTEYFAKKDVSIFTTEYTVAADIGISDCNSIGASLAEAFLKGEFTSLDISYTSFVNVLTQIPKTQEILPIALDEGEKSENSLILYEPSPAAVFAKIVPHYISGIIYGALCESLASELSARRTAMENATDNAGEIIDSLSLQYNRARQAAITQELTEIVAGAQN